MSETPHIDFIQQVAQKWEQKNFPDKEGWMPIVGVQEEVGELSHAFLKRAQGIRGTKEEHDAEIRDAIGDICIYLMSICNQENIWLSDCIYEAWGTVSKRDWRDGS